MSHIMERKLCLLLGLGAFRTFVGLVPVWFGLFPLPLWEGMRFGPPWFNYWFSFTLAYNRISHEYSSFFIIVINLIFMFSL